MSDAAPPDPVPPDPVPPDPPADDPAPGDDAAGGEIVAHGPGGALDAGDRGALLHWLEQSHRDAQAGRAQARELVRALEQVRDAHEYVGRALRDERERNRRLTALLVLAPVLAAIVIWGIWDRLDHLRSDVTGRIGEVADAQDRLREAQERMRFGEAAEAQSARADALEAELERARADLAAERKALVDRAADRAAEEDALKAEIARLENETAEADAVRAQLQALRSRSGVESARSQELEREIRRLERELGAAQASAGTSRPAAAAAAPEPGPAAARPVEAAPDVAAEEEPAGAAAVAVEDDAPEADPLAGAVRRPEDLARIRDELNRLLLLSSDAVKYHVDSIGGVRGETLLDVRLSGVDQGGRAIRTLEAARATIDVRAGSKDVLLDLRDGHLLLAGRQAPFFDGRYAIIVAADVEAWRTSGLTCVTFD